MNKYRIYTEVKSEVEWMDFWDSFLKDVRYEDEDSIQYEFVEIIERIVVGDFVLLPNNNYIVWYGSYWDYERLPKKYKYRSGLADVFNLPDDEEFSKIIDRQRFLDWLHESENFRKTSSLYILRADTIQDLYEIKSRAGDARLNLQIGRIFVAKNDYPLLKNRIHIELYIKDFSFSKLDMHFGENEGGRFEFHYEIENPEAGIFALRDKYEKEFNRFGIKLFTDDDLIEAFDITNRGWEIWLEDFSFENLINEWDDSLEEEYKDSAGEYYTPWKQFEEKKKR